MWTTGSTTTTGTPPGRSSSGMNKINGDLSAGYQKLRAALPRTLNAGFGNIVLDRNRQAIQDQYPLQIREEGQRRHVRGHRTTSAGRPDVRRAFQREDAFAEPDSPGLQEEEAAVDGEDHPGQERRSAEVGGGSTITRYNAEPTLRLRGVGRRFGGLLAVDDVDLDVTHGERRAILGPNGAGKTTLFNVICGDLPASSGTVELFGEDVTTTARPLPHQARARPHLPAVPPVQRADRRGLHLPVDHRRRGRPPAAGAPSGRTGRPASGRATPQARSRSRTSSASSSARSPTASTGRSRSRWRSQPSRRP